MRDPAEPLEERVREIVAHSFSIGISEIGMDFGPEQIEAWDSLGHLRLIMAVEEEFGFQFSTEQIGGVQTIRDIVSLVRESRARG